MTVLVLGNQLTREVGPVAARPDEPVVMIEADNLAGRLPYHPHKLVLVFSAMRHFRDGLRAAGRRVQYHETEEFAEGLRNHLAEHPGDDLIGMRPVAHGAADKLQTVVESAGGNLTFVENDLFLSSPAQFERWAGDREPPYRHEQFYRFLRRERGVLVTDGEPVGGEWNFDDKNRNPPEPAQIPPDTPTFEPDATTSAVIDRVGRSFDGGDWAEAEPFRWPVTRSAALEALETFIDERLAAFGPTQDAMVAGDRTRYHSLLAPLLNLGLLHPQEVVSRVVEAYETNDDVPIESAEGFVRQVLGWREFLRHVYRETMPSLAKANRFGASEPLPEFYWTGETELACVADVVEGVRKHGYSHHIQRLMILSNFALLYGVEPAALNKWFQAAYVDAAHWVTTPNVIEMGLAAAGTFATKPYAASANYIDRMSNYCDGCAYDPDATTGEGACPFNALYWDFLDTNQATLGDNPRLALSYHHLENKDREAIRERAATIRAANGDPQSD
ncbi:MAG: cryptochrome/photolyase family protein [Salinirussus sp.]